MVVTHIVDAAGNRMPDVRVDLKENFLVKDLKGTGLLGEPEEGEPEYTGNEGTQVDRVRLFTSEGALLAMLVKGGDALYLIAHSSPSTDLPALLLCCFIMYSPSPTKRSKS